MVLTRWQRTVICLASRARLVSRCFGLAVVAGSVLGGLCRWWTWCARSFKMWMMPSVHRSVRKDIQSVGATADRDDLPAKVTDRVGVVRLQVAEHQRRRRARRKIRTASAGSASASRFPVGPPRTATGWRPGRRVVCLARLAGRSARGAGCRARERVLRVRRGKPVRVRASWTRRAAWVRRTRV
jgi:hypothetical protein